MNNNKVVFLPGLNGIRILAASGVMIGHITGAIGKLNFTYSLSGFDKGDVKGYSLSEHGVTMFFVLSGFLITYLMLLEREKFGFVKKKEFYIRRALRIWPLYYLYLVVCLAIAYFLDGSNPFTNTTAWYVFFLANVPFIWQFTLSNLDHFWSIGVEEQFYLFWPWFFKTPIRKLMLVTIIIIIVLSVVRVALWYFMPFSVPALFSVVNRFDCMLFGALGAMFYVEKNQTFLKLIDNRMTQAVALLVLLSLVLNVFWFLNSIMEVFVVEAMTLVIIIGQINIRNRIVNFNNNVMDYLGKLSYGIYVIHVLVLHLTLSFFNWKKIDNQIIAIALVYFIVVSFTIALAHLSYNYYEKPFLKLKSHFARIKSSGSKTFDAVENG